MSMLSQKLLVHRGEPFVFINNMDAADLSSADGEQVKLGGQRGRDGPVVVLPRTQATDRCCSARNAAGLL